MYRKLSLLLTIHALNLSLVNAQSNNATTSIVGEIILPDNSRLTGNIKDNIRKKGEVILESNGEKKKFKAREVTSVQLGQRKFLSINYTFYEVLSTGNNGTILRKANEPSGVQYNGNDAFVISSPGKIDDLFIQPRGGAQVVHITKKNANEVLASLCPGRVSSEVTVFDAGYVQTQLNNCK